MPLHSEAGTKMTPMAVEEDFWAGDTLGRKADADFLIDFLLGRLEQRGRQSRPRSYVLNVDAGWGGGKTFFMTRLAKELKQRGHGVALIDAWEDDHADDPLLSLMSGIEATINPLAKSHPAIESTYKVVRKAGLNIAATAAKGMLKQAGRKLMGEAAEIVVEQLGELAEAASHKGQEDLAKGLDSAIDKSAEILLQGFEDGKKSIGQFREQLGKLTAQIRAEKAGWTLFVLIDELDRCRPTHAIALLERVKHLFNVDNVVFVVATDTNQLSESVKAVYGAGFDGNKYLTRFFDRTFQFPETSIYKFIAMTLVESGINIDLISIPSGVSLDQIIGISVEAFKATPRETKRSIEIFSDLIAAWKQSFQIEAIMMVPLVVGYASGKLRLNERSCIVSCISEIRSVGTLTMDLSEYTSSDERNDRVGMWDLMEGLLAFGKEIIETSRANPQNKIARWCHQRIFSEYRSIDKTQIRRNSRLPSVILSYPQIITAAGRLHSDLEPR
ncbi:MAG: hypothetical protein DI537_38840 [Stutzerimonas stutzeri]|nr:MAG: hypothetical protein DI537_38840 [Stutzerimonas stutzeri]